MTDKIKEATLQEMSDIGQEIEMNIKELAEQAHEFAAWACEVDLRANYSTVREERFAELVAEQTHTNNKAKWYQEGYEAGQRDEREACAKLCDNWLVGRDDICEVAKAIRGRQA